MAIAPAATFLPVSRTSTQFWPRFLGHRLAQIGLILIGLLLIGAIFARHISPIDPLQEQAHGLGPLGEPHGLGNGFLLGADTLGRDIWTRTLYGARISLLVGMFAMVTAVLIGTTIGLLGGYFGGWVDIALTRFTEIVMSLPTILLAIVLASVLPDQPDQLPSFLPRIWAGLTHVLPADLAKLGLFKLLLAVALVTWTGIARAVRGQVLSLKEREFIEAARATGCSHARILWRHLLPNVLPTVIVLASLAVANNILLEAGLSYLGLGVDPSTPSWGGMIAEGQPYFLAAPWIILVPGTAIVLAVAGFNLLGQALQETLEPRQ